MTSPKYTYAGVTTELPAFWFANCPNLITVTQIGNDGLPQNRWDTLRWQDLCQFGLRHPRGYIAIDRMAGRIREDGETRASFSPLHAYGEVRYRRRHLADSATGECFSWYTEVALGGIAVAVVHTDDGPRTLFTRAYDPEKGLAQYAS
jgi:hypothetical protein